MRFFDEAAGGYVDVPDRPRRIVSLAPDITDMLFRLVPADRVAGISLYCIRPRDGRLDGLPRVGSYLKVITSRLHTADPDLILTTLGAQRATTQQLRSEGYPVFSIPVPINVWGILDNFLRVAAVVNAWEAGAAQAAELHRAFHQWHRTLPPRKVYWEVDLGGPITAGRHSYVHHTLHWMGLRNVYGDVRDGYFTPNDTETLRRQPELILYEPQKDYDEAGQQRLRQALRQRWGGIPILILPHDFLAHYGPALIDEVMPQLADMLARR